MLLGVDVGGTFTDAVLLGGDRVWAAKVPTTREDQSLGVRRAIDAVLGDSGTAPAAVRRFAHGMTVGTNALLESRGARTALIATAGFADLLAIGRQDRPSLYRPLEPRAEPLVPEELSFEAAERCGPDGVVEPLTEAELERLAEEVEAGRPESVAVCLLFSYLHPEHERRIAARLRTASPDRHVSASSEVLPQFREFERCSTTVIDAYLAPLLSRYLRRLEAAAAEEQLPQPLLMRSSGGLIGLEEAAGSGAWSVLSGPAGGAVGAAAVAGAAGAGDVLGLDMGGTSCDVCVIAEGEVLRTDAREFQGRPIQLPMADIHTVGAGGGSIAAQDPGGALTVGPRSAGSEPGPACYGRGGVEPTVTDANLVLGRLPGEAELAGGVALDAGAAREAVGALAGALGLGLEETAAGIIRLANLEMVRALRRITVERGLDPRRFGLLAFGGAGPMHAAEIAEELEIGRLICPGEGGVLSALGLSVAAERYDTAHTVALSGAELTRERLLEEIGALSRGADGRGAEVRTAFAMRYRGQAFELEIPGTDGDPDPDDLKRRFEEEHRHRYGHVDPEAAIELVTVRVAVTEAEAAPLARGRAAGAAPLRSVRRAFLGGCWADAEVLRGEVVPGTAAEGPAVFELPGSTLVLPPGWSAEADEHGNLIAERREGGGGR